MRYLKVAAVTTAIGAVLAVCVIYLADVGVGRPLLHELPNGYRGRALVQYQRPDCPALRVQGIRLVIPYDATGRACTSSEKPFGWRYRSFVFVESDGRSHSIPEEMLRSSSYSIGDKADTFFIGTDAEFAADRTPHRDRYRNT